MDLQQFERESREFRERGDIWRQQTDEVMGALNERMSLSNVYAVVRGSDRHVH
jgi:hypothetical protein